MYTDVKLAATVRLNIRFIAKHLWATASLHHCITASLHHCITASLHQTM